MVWGPSGGQVIAASGAKPLDPFADPFENQSSAATITPLEDASAGKTTPDRLPEQKLVHVPLQQKRPLPTDTTATGLQIQSQDVVRHEVFQQEVVSETVTQREVIEPEVIEPEDIEPEDIEPAKITPVSDPQLISPPFVANQVVRTGATTATRHRSTGLTPIQRPNRGQRLAQADDPLDELFEDLEDDDSEEIVDDVKRNQNDTPPHEADNDELDLELNDNHQDVDEETQNILRDLNLLDDEIDDTESVERDEPTEISNDNPLDDLPLDDLADDIPMEDESSFTESPDNTNEILNIDIPETESVLLKDDESEGTEVDAQSEFDKLDGNGQDTNDEDNTAESIPDDPTVNDNGTLYFDTNDESSLTDTNQEQFYNDRDCLQVHQDCDDSWRLLKLHDITQISLDITPSFNPNEDDPNLLEQERDERLAKSEFRTWKDRQGNTIASGRFQDLREGRVFITDESNKSIPILFNRLSNDDACYVSAWWGMPAWCRLPDTPFAGRNWVPITMTWKASGIYHKPLYFEQIQTERYGHSFGPVAQPVISAAHFFGHALTLPYQMGIHPPGECQFALGHYRPGSCAPYLWPPFPLSIRGGLLQSSAVVGLVYAMP